MNQLINIQPFSSESSAPKTITTIRRCIVTSYPLHSHDFYELELVTQGRGKHWINNTFVAMQKGSFHLLTLLDIHRIEAEEPLHFVSVKFLPEVAEAMGFLKGCSAHSMVLTPEQYAYVYPIMKAISDEEKRAALYGTQMMYASLQLALIFLLRHGQNHLPAATATHIQRALSYVQAHYAEATLRMTDVADVCGLSACHFSSTFHQLVGCGFSEYLTSLRLNKACALLMDRTATVTEIAYDVGFASLPHFFRVFRQTFGCTPLQYRSTHADSNVIQINSPAAP